MMPTRAVEAEADQVLHAQLAHIAARHRRAGSMLGVRHSMTRLVLGTARVIWRSTRAISVQPLFHSVGLIPVQTGDNRQHRLKQNRVWVCAGINIDPCTREVLTQTTDVIPKNQFG
jgi:hypothetical protein